MENEITKDSSVSYLSEDVEMQEIMKYHIDQEIYTYGTLDLKMREYITLAVLSVMQGKEMIKDHVLALITLDERIEVIKEVVYQVIPYAGLCRVNEALSYVNEALVYVNEALREEGFDPSELKAYQTVTNATRFQAGFDKQCFVFKKEVIQGNHDHAPKDLLHIQEHLSAHCFGDFYTRDGLDLKQRELLTFCIIASLGGCENQLRGHTLGNLNVGNSRAVLIEAITQCQPYIGYPRTLNAINIINEVTKYEENSI